MLLRGAPFSDAPSPASGAQGVVFSRDSNSRTRQGLVTPVPERLWAIRNVANSLARFGEGGEGQVSGLVGCVVPDATEQGHSCFKGLGHAYCIVFGFEPRIARFSAHLKLASCFSCRYAWVTLQPDMQSCVKSGSTDVLKGFGVRAF